MGTGQSKNVKKDYIGPFLLKPDEQSAISALSTIFTSLLNNNNLFDLNSLLKSPESCNDLFITISSLVESEFQLMRIPDPTTPDQMAAVGFMQKSKYPPSAAISVAGRKAACKEILHFIIRLVALTAACVASVSKSDSYAALDQGKLGGDSSEFRTLPRDLYFNRQAISDDVITFLKSAIKPIDKSGRYNLYKFVHDSDYIFDVNNSVLYKSVDFTPVVGITMSLVSYDKKIYNGIESAPVEQKHHSTKDKRRELIEEQILKSKLGILPGANLLSSRYLASLYSSRTPRTHGTHGTHGTRSLSSSSTRRYRGGGGANRTRKYKQSGGDQQKYVKIVVQEIIHPKAKSCISATCLAVVMYMDADGNVYDKNDFENYIHDRSSKQPTPGNFKSKADTVFDNITINHVKTYAQQKRARDLIEPIKGIAGDTYSILMDYLDSMKTSYTGSSPAPYRGYILASNIINNELTTVYCNDTWTNMPVTNTVAYMTLQGLYNDNRQGVSPSVLATDKCNKTVTEFLNAGLVIEGDKKATNFYDVKFAEFPDDIRGICGNGLIKTTNPNVKAALIKSQQLLRNMYEQHISNIVNIMRDVLVIKRNPDNLSEILLKLNPIFFSDSRGAVVVLETIIDKARDVIAKHYFDVENIYTHTLLELNKSIADLIIPAAQIKEIEPEPPVVVAPPAAPATAPSTPTTPTAPNTGTTPNTALYVPNHSTRVKFEIPQPLKSALKKPDQYATPAVPPQMPAMPPQMPAMPPQMPAMPPQPRAPQPPTAPPATASTRQQVPTSRFPQRQQGPPTRSQGPPTRQPQPQPQRQPQKQQGPAVAPI